PPVAGFAANPTAGQAPLTVFFTNLSVAASNYAWDFGDGNASADASPSNTYTNAGSFTVTLVATGPGGTNTLSQTNLILVTSVPPPVVDFIAAPTIGPAPLTVAFTNLSTGAASYAWDFGDGHFSLITNPLNTFSNAGSYTVSLVATGLGGV